MTLAPGGGAYSIGSGTASLRIQDRAPLATPMLSPDGSTLVAVSLARISSPTPGATLHCTTSGSDPRVTDPGVASGTLLRVGPGSPLKVRAFKGGWPESEVKTAVFSGLNRMAVGWNHTLALKADGGVVGWGENVDGQLGVDGRIKRLLPVDIISVGSLVAIAAGGAHSVGLKADGSVWSWGLNLSGELGRPQGFGTAQPLAPGAVPGIADAKAVAAGFDFTLVVRADGEVWAWGRNAEGQLGNGTNSNSHAPVQVRLPDNAVLTGIVEVSAGRFFSAAIDSAGSVYTWGKGTGGCLGADLAERNRAQKVAGIDQAVAVAAGRTHCVVLKRDGTVWGWGNNNRGQLGSNPSGYVPLQIAGLKNIVAIAAGDDHTLAVRANGALLSLGANDLGQLGEGSRLDRNTPTPVGSLSGICQVAARNHSLAVQADGTVFGFGSNNRGQLGNGNTVDQTGPGSYWTFQSPRAPAGLSATATSGSSVALRWEAVPGATGYRVLRSTMPMTGYSELPGGMTGSVEVTDVSPRKLKPNHYVVQALIRSNVSPLAAEVQASVDSDGDGIFDWKEDPAADPDSDGLTNSRETTTDPTLPDTDHDGLPDGWEIANGSDPVSDDQNDDQTPDGDEDWDQDGLRNRNELAGSTSPLDFYNGAVPQIQIVGGNRQRIPSGGIAPEALALKVTNGGGRALANAPVVFQFLNNLGQVYAEPPTALTRGSSHLTVRTDPSGIARVWVRMAIPQAPENVLVSAETTGIVTREFTFQRELNTIAPPAFGIRSWLKAGEGQMVEAGKVVLWRTRAGSVSATSVAGKEPKPGIREGIESVEFNGAHWMDWPLGGANDFTLVSAAYPDAERTVHTPATHYAVRAAASSGQRYLFAGPRGTGSNPWPLPRPEPPAPKKFSMWKYNMRGYSDALYPQPTVASFPYHPDHEDTEKRYDITDGWIRWEVPNPTRNWSAGDCESDFLKIAAVASHFSDWTTFSRELLEYENSYYNSWDWRETYMEVKAGDYKRPYLKADSQPKASLLGPVGVGVSIGRESVGLYELREEYAPCVATASLGAGSRWRIITALYSGGAATVFESGRGIGSGRVPLGGTVNAPRYLGGSPEVPTPFDGGVAEVLAYNRVLTRAERKLAELYLADRIGLPFDAGNNGIPDAWEYRWLGSLGSLGTSDSDQDWFTLAQEYAAGTDPARADSDSDGLSDGVEPGFGTSPLRVDSDSDGYPDFVEVNNRTDPRDPANGRADQDRNGWPDGVDYLRSQRR